MSMEKIVRPFQTYDITPPRRIIDPEEEPDENVILQFGKGGSSGKETASGSASHSVSWYQDKKKKEVDDALGD
jgi:hypothetical protein